MSDAGAAHGARPRAPLAGPILDDVETRRAIDPRALVAALAAATVEAADGRIRCPERLVVPMRDGALLLSMPAIADDIAIHKLISVAPRNAARGLPVLLGSVTVVDPATGQVRLVLDGPTVTGLRTAAMSMLAIEVLRPGPVRKALVIGTGRQARAHVDALAAMHPAAALRVRGRMPEAARAFCDGASSSVAPAVPGERFDVVVACTTSRVPVHVEPATVDTLVIAVGSFTPDAAEIGPATVEASRIYVDDPAGARHEAGDLLAAGTDWQAVRSIASVVAGGGVPHDRPILFKSVGCAAWDLAAARLAVATLSTR